MGRPPGGVSFLRPPAAGTAPTIRIPMGCCMEVHFYKLCLLQNRTCRTGCGHNPAGTVAHIPVQKDSCSKHFLVAFPCLAVEGRCSCPLPLWWHQDTLRLCRAPKFRDEKGLHERAARGCLCWSLRRLDFHGMVGAERYAAPSRW